jgi:hypothetical protein
MSSYRIWASQIPCDGFKMVVMQTQIRDVRAEDSTGCARSTSGEPSFLSDWKSIAEYVGKGVRTVQRWEVQLGLPLRRTHPGRPKSGVMAVL